MWNSTGENKPKQDISKYIRLGLFCLIGIVIFGVVSSQFIHIIMNIDEFSELFTKPIFYAVFSGIVLSTIAVIRVNIRKRESIIWWVFAMGLSFIKRETFEPTQASLKYSNFKLNKTNFAIWQITKILLLAPLFANILFGMSAIYVLNGNDLGIESLSNIFYLPFITSPDPTIAEQLVIPMVPSLVLLVPALLGSIGIRLMLYVGIRNIVHIASSYVVDFSEGRPKFLLYISIVEFVIGAGLLWVSFNMFFTHNIDYNTKYAIIGAALLGAAFITWSVIDRKKSAVIILPSKRNMYVRLLTLISMAIVIGSVMAVNNSIADAKKIEYLGPYTAQQIAVNRYFAELDEVKEINYDVKLFATKKNSIRDMVQDNQDVLTKIRLWDWNAAFTKLKPEIGLIPYVDFQDSDVIRFNNTLYWSAAMKPILPSSVTPENRWYAQHLVYTHVPNGFLMLNAHSGEIANSDRFFDQRRIYYGEGGLIEEVWSAYPEDRKVSDELGEFFYSGNGGIKVIPPISWIFEPNFLLSYPDKAIHIMRYKDIHERMSLIYPYFQYQFGNKDVDVLPVTNGSETFWLMPLLVRLDTSNVPWSANNPMYRLVGYSLIDTLNGTTTVMIKGDDFFTNMFVDAYQEHVTKEIPAWLHDQLRFPEEYFSWKVNMYNYYHVTDVSTFIGAREFFEIPIELSSYYIFAKPPGFDKTEYLGLLSLELKGAAGRNLAGYMVVKNDYPNDGEMIFYEVPLESETKLLGPTAIREALDRDPDFAQLKTLLRNPRIGDNIIYRIGENDVYFMPVYTAGTGGVVTQLGTVAAVGAAFTGEYYVGLGQNVEEAYKAYLSKLLDKKISSTISTKILERDSKMNNIIKLFVDKNVSVVKPTMMNLPLTFQEQYVIYDIDENLVDVEKAINDLIDKWLKVDVKRVLMWENEEEVHFGVAVIVDGVIEMHYITVEV
ncbi:MAG: hypothetical protein EX285_01575 [Thaumarchaeota archaeon]|nr:hypothetical protein [Nitrososphaerota archaeon]